MFKYKGGNIVRNTQVINVNEDSILIFKIMKPCEVKKEYKEDLGKKLGCKCIILGQDMELEKVINKKELSEEEIKDKDIVEIETTNMYASGKLLVTTIKYKYREEKKQSTCPEIPIGLHPSG